MILFLWVFLQCFAAAFAFCNNPVTKSFVPYFYFWGGGRSHHCSTVLFSHRELPVKEGANSKSSTKEAPPNIDPPDDVGETIYNAARAGLLEVLSKVTEEWGSRAPLNWQSPAGSETPVFAAIRGGHVQCLEALLESGADVNMCDSMGESPAMIAAKLGKNDCMQLLVRYKAKLNQRSRIGATAVYWAAFRGQVKCLKILIDGGADVSIPNSFGVTPLKLAQRENHQDCVSLLILQNNQP